MKSTLKMIDKRALAFRQYIPFLCYKQPDWFPMQWPVKFFKNTDIEPTMKVLLILYFKPRFAFYFKIT